MSQSLPNDFVIIKNTEHITSIKRHNDPLQTEFIRPYRCLGHINLTYRQDQDPWRIISSLEDKSLSTPTDPLIETQFLKQETTLEWQITIKNNTNSPIEIDGLELPFEFNEEYTRDPKESFERRVFKHSHICGHNSFLFWMPVGGVGLYLLMTPNNQTKLEFFQARNGIYASGGASYSSYIHSKAISDNLSGTWRQENTSLMLNAQEEIHYGFTFQWCDSYQDVREEIYRSDVRDNPAWQYQK